MPAPNPVGIGPILPFTFDAAGEFAVVSERELVLSALDHIFAVQPGERPADMDWGQNFTQLLFMQWDPNVKTLAEQLVVDLVSAYEDRIQVVSAEARRLEDPTEIRTVIRFIWRDSGSESETEVVIG